MANNLTLTSAGFNGSGKFGSSLSAGNGQVANPYPQTGTWTLEAWVKTTSTANMVAVGANLTGWIGVISGASQARYGASPNEVQIAGPAISDGAWHHVALVVGPSGGAFYVDGVRAGTNAATFATATGAYSNPLGVHTFGGVGGFDWSGEVDEVALWSSAKYASNFTPPTAAYSGSESALVSLWHLDGTGADSAGVASGATQVTLSLSAASGAVGSPVTVTVGTDVALTSVQSETVSLSSNVAGTFSPTSVSLSSTTATATATFTPSAAGTATITGAASGTPTLSNGTATYTVNASNNVLTSGTANVLFSPYNWNVTASTAKTINAGAYFKARFTGTTCALQFDMSSAAAPYSEIAYRIDGYGAWTVAPIAANVLLTLPSDTADYASKGGHLLEVVVKSTSETISRWSTQQTAVSLTGIILDAGATISKPPALPLNAIFYGDSITEGVRTVNATATNDTDRNDAAQGWAFQVARILGAEAGIVGFGATGFVQSGSGGVPVFGSTYNQLWSGQARSFTPAPDFIVINEGTNDGSNDTTSAATTVFNALLALNTTTQIFVLRPFNGNQATNLQNVVNSINNPRLKYIDTTGFFTSGNSADALHPYGVENIAHIAPSVANAIRPYVHPVRGSRTARTVTLTLQDRNGNPRASLTGLKWAFFDQTTASALGINADAGANASTNASGALSLTVNTTLAPGGTGWLVISDSSGSAAAASNAFAGPVTVS